MYRYFKLVIIPILFLSSGFLLAMAVFFINTPYSDFTNAIIEIYHLEAKAEIIQSKYLTINTYESIKYIFITIALIVPLLSFYVFIHLELIYTVCKEFIRFLKDLLWQLYHQITILSITEKYIVVITFLFLSAARVYFAFTYPIHIDEAFSYVFIVSKGWLATISYYPGPNNHVAYLLLCAPFQLFFNDPQIIMRLPAVLVSTVTSALFFLVIKRYMGFIYAYATVVFFSFSEYGMFYAVHGRGYFMMLLLFITALISLIKSINFGSRYYYLLFCLTAAIGFYTIPIFAYPLASMLVGSFIYAYITPNTRKVGWLLVSGLLVFLITTLLYFPIIVTNGYSALIGNEWVKPLSSDAFYENIFFYLADTPGTFYSLDIYGTWISVLNLAFWFWILIQPQLFTEKLINIDLRKIGIFVICFYLVPLAMLCIQQVMPGARTWLYLSLIEYTSILITFKVILKTSQKKEFTQFSIGQPTTLVHRSFPLIINSKKKKILLLFATFFYVGCMLFYIQNYTLYRETIYEEHPRVTQTLVEENALKILATEDLYNVFLRYEAMKDNINLLIDTEINLQREFYDFLVLTKGREFPEHLDAAMYKKRYEDNFVEVYKRFNK